MRTFPAPRFATVLLAAALVAAGCSKEEPKPAAGGAAAPGSVPIPAPAPAPAPEPEPPAAGAPPEAEETSIPDSQGVFLKTVPGAALGAYSIFDAAGERRLQEACAPDRLVGCPAGRFQLRERYSSMPYGKDVEVAPGRATEVLLGALKVVTREDAGLGSYSIFDATGENRLREQNDPDRVVSAGPGRYQLFERYSSMPYGRDVEVKAGETTEVVLGAVKLETVEGAVFGSYSIFDAKGEKRLREQNDADREVSAGPGRYQLFERYSSMPYGWDVDVKPGETTVVPVGAVRLVTVEGATHGAYSFFDSKGERRLREQNDPDEAVTAGPGRYQLFDRYSSMPYGKDVIVQPGETTDVPVGAVKLITVEGAVFGAYSIFDAKGENRLREQNDPGEAVTAGPGRYQLLDRYSSVPYGKDVEVKPGEVTEVAVGAIRGPASGEWSIFDAAGEKRLRERNEAGALVTVGPGSYLIRDRASGKDLGRVEVAAGAVAVVR